MPTAVTGLSAIRASTTATNFNGLSQAGRGDVFLLWLKSVPSSRPPPDSGRPAASSTTPRAGRSGRSGSSSNANDSTPSTTAYTTACQGPRLGPWNARWCSETMSLSMLNMLQR